MKSSNSWRTKLWSSISLCQSRSKYARREERRKEKQSEENRGQAAAVFMRTFGALPEVHFLHSIYHLKAQEVKNPMLQMVRNLELKWRSYSHCKLITPSWRKDSAKCCEITLLLRNDFAAFLHSAMDFPEVSHRDGSQTPQDESQLRSGEELAFCCKEISQPSLCTCGISQTSFFHLRNGP